MKIYYQVPDQPYENEDMADNFLDKLPEEFRPTVKPIVDRLIKLQHEYVKEHFERMKFRFMWSLRFLEQEINEEGGAIIITKNGQVETKNFTPELTEKIKEHLTKNYDDV